MLETYYSVKKSLPIEPYSKQTENIRKVIEHFVLNYFFKEVITFLELRTSVNYSNFSFTGMIHWHYQTNSLKV